MNPAFTSTVDTPIGPFTAIVDGDGAVLASGWTSNVDDLLPLVYKGIRPAEVRAVADLGAVTKAVRAYHDGELSIVDGVQVRQHGGEFLSHAWQVLRDVPPGGPIS